MKQIAPFLTKVAADERGATAIEYCLIASVISISIVVSATQIGQTVLALLSKVNTGFE